jgi:lipopolysaccharide/colanic/teichoic acid biosynthesis glycosyltransferase
MIVNAENNGAVFTTVNDNRITSFGKFCEKTRIDEIHNVIFLKVKLQVRVLERPNFVKK